MEKTIFLLDDEDSIREAIKAGLERISYASIVEEMNALEAKKRIPDLNPDLLILDVMNGYLNGGDLLEALVQEIRVPTLVITASHKNEQARKAVFWAQRMYTAEQRSLLDILSYDRIADIPRLDNNLRPYFMIKPFSLVDLRTYVSSILGV
jgi:CheY-like chemotaxis protein